MRHLGADVAHAAPGIGEHGQDPQAGRVGQRREHRGRPLDFDAGWFNHHRSDHDATVRHSQ